MAVHARVTLCPTFSVAGVAVKELISARAESTWIVTVWLLVPPEPLATSS